MGAVNKLLIWLIMGADTTCDKQEISCSAIVDALSNHNNLPTEIEKMKFGLVRSSKIVSKRGGNKCLG